MKTKILICCITAMITLSGCAKQLNQMQIQPSNSQTQTEETQDSTTPIPEYTVAVTATATKELKMTEQITPTTIAIPTIQPTSTPTIAPTTQPTEIPTATPSAQPTATPKSTAEPTPEPTQAPEYTVISGQIRSGALDGINEAREEESNPLAALDSSLNAKAEAHAIEMAKANSLYHSTLGYTESVRSGAFIGGWAEGYGAANHATQLCMDADIIRIGVGSARSADGTVYTCIIGGR